MDRKNRCLHNLYKKISGVILCICLMSSSLPNCVQATEHQTVKVGFFKFDGYHEIDANGHYNGYGYEFMKQIGRYSNFDFEYVGYDKSWSEMQQMLNNGGIDVLTYAQKTPEREEKYDFTKEPIGTSATILTVRSGDDRFAAGDYDSYNGMKVGVLENSTRNESFQKFASEKGFQYTMHQYGTNDDLMKALRAERVDAIVTSNLREIGDESILDEFDPTEFYAIVKKGNTDLLSQLDTAIEQMDLNMQGWRTQLFQKYYTGSQDGMIMLSAEEKKYLNQLAEEKVVWKVTVNPDRAPCSYFENGQAKGIIPELFQTVSENLGLSYEIIEPADRKEYLELVSSGKIDLVMDGRLDYAEAEETGYEMTMPYLTVNIARLTRANNKGKLDRIAELKHPDVNDKYRKALYIGEESQSYDSISECIEAVRSGMADATYLYGYTAQAVINRDYRDYFQINILEDYGDAFGIGVRDDLDYKLLTSLDKGVNSLTDNLIHQTIVSNTSNKEHKVTFTEFVYTHPLIVIIFFTVMAGLFSFMIYLLLWLKQKNVHEQRDRKHQLLMERFIGYMCDTYELITEVNTQDMTYQRYSQNQDEIQVQRFFYKTIEGIGATGQVYPDDDVMVREKCSAENVEKMIATGGMIQFECRAREKDQEEFKWHQFIFKSIPVDSEHPANFIIFKRDIDETKKEEEQQKHLILDALEQARSASEAKGNFMSKMSHEIRTPLNAVIGYMTMAQMADGNQEKIMHCIQNSELAAKHLLNIINDVLDISAIESGKMKIANEDFDLKKLITTLTTIFYTQASQKKVDFIVNIRQVTEEWVVGDELRVNQILMNLLSNAVKFTPENGKITLSVTQVDCQDKIVHFKFEVSDSGIGMSKEYIDRLFKPFEQESATTAQKYGGSGLGLSIANNLIRMMNGSIQVESEKGQGTTFTVLLKFNRSDKNATALDKHIDFSNIRVLIVDDENDNCDYVKSLLKRCGVKSDCVNSGEKALKRLESRKGTDYEYNICILDWNMPDMDGVDTARMIRKLCGDSLPIIIATAYDVTSFENEAKAAGVSKIIAKPLFQSTLFDLLVSQYGGYEIKPKDTISNVDLEGMTILLTEDNEMNMEIAVDILEKANVHIIKAYNGQEAYEKFMQSEPGSIGAILMDVQMPIMNGYEATKAIRRSSHPEAKSIRIIAMTANAFAEDISEALASGMNAHIAKPIDFNKLFEALRNTN